MLLRVAYGTKAQAKKKRPKALFLVFCRLALAADATNATLPTAQRSI